MAENLDKVEQCGSFASSDAFHRSDDGEVPRECVRALSPDSQWGRQQSPESQFQSQWGRQGSPESLQSQWGRQLWERPNGQQIHQNDVQIRQDDSVQDTLRRVEARLDKLSSQMTDALSGIRVLYKTSPGRIELQPKVQTREGRGVGGLHVGVSQPTKAMGDCEFSHAGSGGGDHASSTYSSFADLPRSQSVYQAPRRTMSSFSSLHDSRARGPGGGSGHGSPGQSGSPIAPTRRRSSNDHVLVHSTSRSRLSISLPAGELSVDETSTVTSSRAATWMRMHGRARGRVSIAIWNFLDNPESGVGAYIYHRLNPIFILLSVMTSVIQQVSPHAQHSDPFLVVELVTEGLFALEILVRYAVCPNRWFFFIHAYNMIDLVSTIPLVFRILQIQTMTHGEEDHFLFSVVMGFVPATRLLKTLRRFEQMHLLLKAFQLAAEALPVTLFVFMVVWLFFTGAIMGVEERSDIQTLGQAMWLVFCSMTSTTFGDLVPRTVAGQILTSVLVTTSTLYMAIPIGIIGKCFSRVWTDRDKILLVERMRQVFRVNGFAPPDIPVLFSHFDPDGNGILSVDEFVDMATALRLGLSEDRLLTLFQIFDGDGSGGVDDKEFCRIVFPEAFYYIFKRNTLGVTAGMVDGGQSQGTRAWLPSFLL